MQIPNEITIDVGHLDIGDAVHVSELTLDEEIDILDEPERIIAAVSQARIQLEDEVTEAEDGEGEEEEATEEQPTEPEIISRRRDDDDE